MLSLNFNLGRIYRGAPAGWDDSALGYAYAVLYGWQDRLAGAFIRRPSRSTVFIASNFGLSPQLLVLGACLAVGHPRAYVGVVGVCLAVLVVLVTIDRRKP